MGAAPLPTSAPAAPCAAPAAPAEPPARLPLGYKAKGAAHFFEPGMDWNSDAAISAEQWFALNYGRKFKERGPPAPEEGGPTRWRHQAYREQAGRWGKRGGARKAFWSAFNSAPLKALAAADRAKAAATAAHAQLAPIPERFAEYAPPGSRIHRKADGAPADAAPKADESVSSAPPAASAVARETASAACPPEARDAPDDESESYARMDPY